MNITAAAAILLVGACGGRPEFRTLAHSPAGGQIASADPSLARYPSSDDVLMSWVGSDGSGWRIWFARSSDAGETWSPTVRVTQDTGEVKPHGEASPRLVAGPGGRVAIVWPRDVPVPGRRWPASAIRLARSLDGGRTWLAPVTINDDTTGTPTGHNFRGAALAGDSGLVAAWLDERSGAPPARVHDDRWVYPGCPHNGPGLSLGADGVRHVVWYTAANGRAGLYYRAVPMNGGPGADTKQALGEPVALVQGRRLPPVHAAVAALPGGGAIVAMDARLGGSRLIGVAELPPGERRARVVAVSGSEGGTYPQILSVSDTVALVAYTVGLEDRREVRLVRVILRQPHA